MPDEKLPPSAEVAPDPPEDDLDELDDVLDEFSATRIEDAANTNPNASGPGRPPAPTPAADAALTSSEDFARDLQEGMAELLGEIESSPEFRKELDSLVKVLGDAAPNAQQSPQAEASTGAGKDAEKAKHSQGNLPADKEAGSFQATIERMMERMEESNEQAGRTSASAEGDDILAQMLKEMESGGLGDGGTEEDFSKMLLGMMEQLTNKEILFEPMQELHQKFPGWMEKNRENVSQEDLKRYEEQQRLVRDIVERFEAPGYSDTNAHDREYIVERMQKMQAAGSPPPDLISDMSAAQEALGDIDAGCPTQ